MLSAAGIAGPASVRAQPAVADLETVIVTGSRLPESGVVVPRIMTSDQLAVRNSPSSSEALARMPGIYLAEAGGRGGVSSLFLRGAEPNFAAVLVDGIQVNDPTNSRGGSFDFSLLNIDDIAHVELVSGPQSSVYGSDMLAGIVHVVTLDPSEAPTGRALVELGTDDYQRVGLRFGGAGSAAAQFGAFASYAADGADTDPASHRSKAIGGRLTVEPAAGGRLDMTLRHAQTDAHAFPDASGGPSYAVLSATDVRDSSATTLGIDWRAAAADGIELELSGNVFGHREHTTSPGVAAGSLEGLPPSDLATDFTRALLTAYARVTRVPRVHAVVGLNLRDEEGESDGTVELAPDLVVPTDYRIDRTGVAAFAEVVYQFSDRIAADVAWRIDDFDDWGQETTGQVTVSFTPDRMASRVFLAWGEGFKLPSLFALAHPLVGNPELQPENARSIEIGAEFRMGAAGSWDVRAFSQHFRDVIDFDFESFRSVNRSAVDSAGVELGMRYAIGVLMLDAHATWLDIRTPDGGPPLTHRPERLAVIDAVWQLGARAEMFLGWRYVDERFDVSIPTGGYLLPAYDRADFGVEWQGRGAMRWRLSLDNLTDARYETAVGFPVQGRRLRLSWQHALGAAQ